MTQNQGLKVSYQYISWILKTNRGIMAHTYTLTSQAGEVEYFTDFDTDINVLGQTYTSGSLRFEGLQRKVSIGVAVDEQTLKIWASPSDTLWGANFLAGAQQGLLDGATIQRSRVIWPFLSGNVQQDIQQTPIAVWPMFTGYMSSIDKGGASHLEFKVKSAMLRLNVNMPRNYWQPGCLWTLFDQGCGVNKATYAVDGVIGPGVASLILPIVGGVNPANGPDGIPYYSQGKLLFTSGVLEGQLIVIDNNTNLYLSLTSPLNELPSPGDTVTFYPGCSKANTTCTLKYNNAANFRGFDKVPPIMVSV